MTILFLLNFDLCNVEPPFSCLARTWSGMICLTATLTPARTRSLVSVRIPLLKNDNTPEMASPGNRLTLTILKKEADYVPVYTTLI